MIPRGKVPHLFVPFFLLVFFSLALFCFSEDSEKQRIPKPEKQEAVRGLDRQHLCRKIQGDDELERVTRPRGNEQVVSILRRPDVGPHSRLELPALLHDRFHVRLHRVSEQSGRPILPLLRDELRLGHRRSVNRVDGHVVRQVGQRRRDV